MKKKYVKFIFILSSLLFFTSVSSFGQNTGGNPRPFQSNWKSLSHYHIPEWFKDAKFGIFIHWGVYSVPAHGSEWYPHWMYIKGSKIYQYHTKHYGSPLKFGYKNFIPMFKAQKFNPTAWAKLFKKAGAKYVVPVAEHHDGFPMYNCSYTKWNAYRMGPHRDIIAALDTAVRKEGLKFGVSSHRARNWYYYVHSKDFDTGNPKYAGLYGVWHKPNAPPNKAFLHDWFLRTKELINKFKPDLLYFDGGINHQVFIPYRKKIAAYYYNKADSWSKGVVLTYKEGVYPDKTAVLDVERGKFKNIKKLHWQTDTSVGKKSWGYIKDEDYRTPNSLVDNLVDIVSKNGNFLLNIGPKSDGTIPIQAKNDLLAIGKWLKVNGEAIYSTRPWFRYREGIPSINSVAKTENDEIHYTSADIRYTTKNGNVYAICLGWPGKELKLQYVKAGKKTKINLLGYNKNLKWQQQGKSLTIDIPEKLQIAKNRPCKYAYAFRIINPLDPFVKKPVVNIIKENNKRVVTIIDKTENAVITYTTDGTIPNANSKKYYKAITINEPTFLHATAFKKGMFKSTVIDTQITTGLSGLNYKYYKGSWKKLPDFKKLTPIKSGIVKNFKLLPGKMKNHWGMVFSGYLKIYHSGKYKFFLDSDDGSKLYLDNNVIIDNDGSHGSLEKASDTIQLETGLHKIKVDYFQDYAGQKLMVSIKGSKLLKQPIPSTFLYLSKK